MLLGYARDSAIYSSAAPWQTKIGLKYLDAFNIKKLNLHVELNSVRPYTYSAQDEIKNYGQLNQSSAHHYGANFREFVIFGNFSVRRFQFKAKAGLGLDPPNADYGSNIYLSLTELLTIEIL